MNIELLKDRTELLSLIDKNLGSKYGYLQRRINCIKSVLSLEKTYGIKKVKNSVMILSPTLNHNFLYLYDDEHKLAGTIDYILMNLKEQKKYLDMIKSKHYITYVHAMHIMLKEETLSRFYSFDYRVFCHGFNNSKLNILEFQEAFKAMPFFDGDYYFIHTLTSMKWRHWYSDQLITRLLANENGKEILTFLCSSEVRKQPFWECLNVDDILSIKDNLANIQAIELLNLLYELDSSLFYKISVKYIFESRIPYEQITPIIKEASKYVKGISVYTIINFLIRIGYDMKIAKRLNYCLMSLEEDEQKNLFQFPVFIIISWLFKDEDMIALVNEDGFPFSEMYPRYGYKDFGGSEELCKNADILSHATVFRKKHFLSLLKQGKIGSQEIIYLNNSIRIVEKYININEFNEKQFKWIADNRTFDDWEATSNLPQKEDGKKYSFNETKIIGIIVKMESTVRDTLLYILDYLLKTLRSDDACIRMMQYVNSLGDNFQVISENKDKISAALSAHDMPQWKKILFKFDASKGLVAESLMFTEYQKTLNQTQNETEARFVFGHYELCKNGIDIALEKFMETDIEVKNLMQSLGLSTEFMEKYKNEMRQFCLDGNARIANMYLKTLTDSDAQRKFKIVIKAALSNQVTKLRYYENDLDKECSISFTDRIKDAWVTDKSLISCVEGKKYVCYEDTSFRGIMDMGVVPMITCMSYYDGVYSNCLLSYFDANKKIVYIKDNNNKIVARAVLRITKMTTDRNASTSLDFNDVTEGAKEKGEERIVIFLECLYTGRQDDLYHRLMIEFAKTKSKDAGISLVVSDNYKLVMDSVYADEFKPTIVGIYITKSKAAYQYLDSLGGYKTRNAAEKKNLEDVYVFGSCYLQN